MASSFCSGMINTPSVYLIHFKTSSFECTWERSTRRPNLIERSTCPTYVSIFLKYFGMIYFQFKEKKFLFKVYLKSFSRYSLSMHLPFCLLSLIHLRKLSGSNAASIRVEKQANRRRIQRIPGNPRTLASIVTAMRRKTDKLHRTRSI